MILFLLSVLVIWLWIGWEIVTAPVECSGCGKLLYSGKRCPFCRDTSAKPKEVHLTTIKVHKQIDEAEAARLKDRA